MTRTKDHLNCKIITLEWMHWNNSSKNPNISFRFLILKQWECIIISFITGHMQNYIFKNNIIIRGNKLKIIINVDGWFMLMYVGTLEATFAPPVVAVTNGLVGKIQWIVFREIEHNRK